MRMVTVYGMTWKTPEPMVAMPMATAHKMLGRATWAALPNAIDGPVDWQYVVLEAGPGERLLEVRACKTRPWKMPHPV